MRSIYREAERVWVWLGEGSYEVNTTFDFLSEVVAILERHDPPSIFHDSMVRELKEPLDLFNGKPCGPPKSQREKRSFSKPRFANAVVSMTRLISISSWTFFISHGSIARGPFKN